MRNGTVQLQDIIRRRSELTEDRSARVKAHNEFLHATASELGKLDEAEALLVVGVDVDRIARGRQIIDIQGEVSDARRGVYGDGSGVRAQTLADAKADLANGGTLIGTRYFGVKNYDGFGDQRADCEYGMGPRHGSIVFRIGLTRALQQRVRTGPHLECHEIEDALYLLSALPSIEALRAEQQKAA